MKHAFQRYCGPQVKPEYVYTDGSQEYASAFDQIGLNCDCSRPYRPETNGIAERAVRTVSEGTAASILQSGFHQIGGTVQ